MEETPFSYQPPPQPKSSKMSPTLIVGAVILALIIGTFLIIGQTNKTEEKKEEQKIVVEKNEPSPTSKPEIDKTTVKIQVLNGTGTPGQAGEVVTILEDEGFSAENIKTGNADNYDNTTLTIEIKEGFEDVAKDIESALKSEFDKISIKSVTLDKDSEYDVVITTGGKIYSTPTPSKSASPTEGPTSSPTPTVKATETPTPTPTP